MGGLVLFPAPEPSYHPLEYEGELLWVPRVEDMSLQKGIPCMLLQNPRAARFLLWFHANAEDLGRIYVNLRYLRTLLGVHVLAVEYPGYGVCSGEASEESLLSDADLVMAFVRDELQVPLDSVFVMGRSVGGVPAIYVASKYTCAGLVSISTFSTLHSVAGNFSGMAAWFIGQTEYDNLSRIRSVDCPALLLHGSEDMTVGMNMAFELSAACGVDVKERKPVNLVIREGKDHNNLDVKQDIIYPIHKYFPDLHVGEPLVLTRSDIYLKRQPEKLAHDVQSRCPYDADWLPNKPPYKNIRMVDFGRDI